VKSETAAQTEGIEFQKEDHLADKWTWRFTVRQLN
jgi:hypothetical protein